MRVAVRRPGAQGFPFALVERPDSQLPTQEWARVRVTGNGICGTDTAAAYPQPGRRASRIWGPFVCAHLELGHEFGGIVVEAGVDCDVPVGTRVAVDPSLPCRARGFRLCRWCAAGDPAGCEELASQAVTRGMALGFTEGLGSGCADQVVAHRSQLHPVPEAFPTAALPLVEPLSVAAHGVMRRPLPADAGILVIGAGVIGLGAVAAARRAAPRATITAVARYPHQGAAAGAVGADHVIGAGPDALGQLAEISGSRITGKGDGRLLVGGFPVTIDAVGTGSSLEMATRVTEHHGRIHLLGAAAVLKLDLSAVWFRELEVVGSFSHSQDSGMHSFDRAIDLISGDRFPHELIVSHRFPLARIQEAFSTAHSRSSGALKVVLEP